MIVMRQSALLFSLLALVSCAEEATPSSDLLATGTPECAIDAQCADQVCWRFADYDPECGGSVCSLECDTDRNCRDAAEGAGAPSPDEAHCGSDGRCVLLDTGLAAFLCIRPQPECSVAADCGYNTVDSEWSCNSGSCFQSDGVENPCMDDTGCPSADFCYLDPELNRDLGVCVPEQCRSGGDCPLDDGGIIFIDLG